MKYIYSEHLCEVALLVRNREDVHLCNVMYNRICIMMAYTVYWSPVAMKCMRDDMLQAGVSGHKTRWDWGQ